MSVPINNDVANLAFEPAAGRLPPGSPDLAWQPASSRVQTDATCKIGLPFFFICAHELRGLEGFGALSRKSFNIPANAPNYQEAEVC